MIQKRLSCWYWMIVVTVIVDGCYSGDIEVVDVTEIGKIDVEVNPIFSDSYEVYAPTDWNALTKNMEKAMDALPEKEFHHIADNIGEPKEKRSMWSWRGEELKDGTQVFALVEYHHTNEVSKVKSILKAIVKETIQKYDDFPGQITCTYPSVGEKQGKSGAGVHLPKDKDGIGVSVGLYIYFPTAEFPVLDLATENVLWESRKDGKREVYGKKFDAVEKSGENQSLSADMANLLRNVEIDKHTRIYDHMTYSFQWHAGKHRATYQDPSAHLAGPLKALLYHIIRTFCRAILHSNGDGSVSSAASYYVWVEPH